MDIKAPTDEVDDRHWGTSRAHEGDDAEDTSAPALNTLFPRLIEGDSLGYCERDGPMYPRWVLPTNTTRPLAGVPLDFLRQETMCGGCLFHAVGCRRRDT